MIFYLLCISPLWSNIKNLDRIIRLLVIAAIIYIFIYMLITYKLKDTSFIYRYIKYVYILILFDIMYLSNCTYNLYYSKNTLKKKNTGDNIKISNNKSITDTNKNITNKSIQMSVDTNINTNIDTNTNNNTNTNTNNQTNIVQKEDSIDKQSAYLPVYDDISDDIPLYDN
jgi:hypothetical protein